jgi:hypothetical protein
MGCNVDMFHSTFSNLSTILIQGKTIVTMTMKKKMMMMKMMVMMMQRMNPAAKSELWMK